MDTHYEKSDQRSAISDQQSAADGPRWTFSGRRPAVGGRILKRSTLLCLTYALAVCTAGTAAAQATFGNLAGQRRPAVVSIAPVHEQYSFGDVELSQSGTSVYSFLPLGRKVAVGMRAGFASSQMQAGPSVSGLTDAYLWGSVSQEVGDGSLVLGFSTTLPSGKQQFSVEEAGVVREFGWEYYGFRAPGFGQGFGAGPSVTLALPVSDAVVLGFGTSYMYRGEFEPRADMAHAYDPGDEVTVTGGFDLRFSASSNLSADVTHVWYDNDRMGGLSVYAPGNKLIGTVQLRQLFGRHEVALLGRYRSRGDNLYRVGLGDLTPEAQTTTPQATEIMARYGARLHRLFRLGLLGEATFMEQTLNFPTSFYEVGLAPEIIVSRRLSIPVQFRYRFGDVSGYLIETGVTTRF